MNYSKCIEENDTLFSGNCHEARIGMRRIDMIIVSEASVDAKFKTNLFLRYYEGININSKICTSEAAVIVLVNTYPSIGTWRYLELKIAFINWKI